MIVLAIQDNPQEMALLRGALTHFTNSPILVEHADRLSVALSYLAVRRFDAILLDLNLTDSAGLDRSRACRRRRRSFRS
jgi:DNA-binding response OmpR family regulator